MPGYTPNIFSYYQLDPAHFYTLPGLSWQACLKLTEVELELLADPEMYLFIEDGLRGCMHGPYHNRCPKAGLSDRQTTKSQTSLDILNIADDASEGYILEVDLEYPCSLHECVNDYPLAPERATVNIDMLYLHTARNWRKMYT